MRHPPWLVDKSVAIRAGIHSLAMLQVRRPDVWVWLLHRHCVSRLGHRRGRLGTVTSDAVVHEHPYTTSPGQTDTTTSVNPATSSTESGEEAHFLRPTPN